MKHLIAFFLIAIGVNAFAQNETHVWEKNASKATELSISEKKPLMLFYTGSDWCAACKKLHNEVFAQPEFQEWAKNNVIPVELDFPRNKQPDPEFVEQNNKLKEIFGVSSYPTVIFVNPESRNNNVYYSRIGNLGYMAGGPEVWLKAASNLLPTKK